jgi:hypothetical protein
MPDRPSKGRVFTQEEVNSILSRAVERQSPSAGGLTYEELLDTARQAGISVEAIDAAASEVESGLSITREDEHVRSELAARTWRERRGFAIHLTVYAMVMALLGAINWQTWHEGDRVLWVLYPLLGWGIGLAAHFTRVTYGRLFPDPRAEERVRLELRKREEKRRRRESRGALKQSAKELGVAVERGMANLLSDVAKTIHETVDGAPGEQRADVRVGSKTRVQQEDEEDDADEEPERNARGSRRS